MHHHSSATRGCLIGPGRILGFAACCLVALSLAAVGRAQEVEPGPARVLILTSFGRDFAPFGVVTSRFKTELAEHAGRPVEFYEPAVETARFEEGGVVEAHFVEYPRSLFAERDLDLVVAVGGPAVRFWSGRGQSIHPDARVLAVADPRVLRDVPNMDRAAAVLVENDLRLAVENILQVAPATRRILVVLGSSPLEIFWRGETQRIWERYRERVEFEWMSDLDFAAMKARAAAGGPDTAVFFGLLSVDARGVPHEQDRALRELCAASTGPVFGLYDYQFGLGIVGGSLLEADAMIRAMAESAARVLRGAAPGSIPPRVIKPGRPKYDWRALQRWGLREADLPEGSVVLMRPPTLWGTHRWTIILLVFVIVAEGGLLGLLVVQVVRRRRVQRRLDEQLSLEQLVSEISRRLMQSPPAFSERVIVDALERVARHLGFAWAKIAIGHTGQPDRTALVWSAGGTPTPAAINFEADFPWRARQVAAGRSLWMKRPDELPGDAAVDRASCARLGIVSACDVALAEAGRPIGVLSLASFRVARPCHEEAFATLRILGEIVAGALARRRAVDALQASERRLGLAAAAANLGLWAFDRRTGDLWTSERTRIMFGFRPDAEPPVAEYLERIDPDDRVKVENAVAGPSASQGDYSLEYRIRLPDGTVRWIEAHAQAEEINGNGLKLIGTVCDTTERVLAEQRFRFALEALPSAVVLARRDGRIVLVNARAENLFGCPRAALAGRSVEQIIPGSLRDGNGPRAAAVAAYALSARHADGREIPVELGAAPIQTDEGAFLLLAIRDLTEERRTAAELHRHRQELAHVARVLTMGELSASMAHELNQPLTAIMANAQAAARFISSGRLDLAEFSAILADIVHDTTRARDVIRNLRAMVRKGERSWRPIHVNDLVNQVIGFLHGDIVGRNVSVACRLSSGLPMVTGDPVQLQQVLLNLLLNAFDAMERLPTSERHVAVDTILATPGAIELTVRDRGPGIPCERLEKIFEPFFSTKPEGMGMGLSISRSIVEAHGGRLQVENNPDRGACFRVLLGVAGFDKAGA